MVMHNNHRIIREVPQGFVIFYVVALSRKIYSARPCFKLKYLLFFFPGEYNLCLLFTKLWKLNPVWHTCALICEEQIGNFIME